MMTDLLDSVTAFDIGIITFFSDTETIIIFSNKSIMRGS